MDQHTAHFQQDYSGELCSQSAQDVRQTYVCMFKGGKLLDISEVQTWVRKQLKLKA